MAEYIAVMVGFLVNIAIFSFGYGKLVNKVDKNREDINYHINFCNKCRDQCRVSTDHTNEELFTKLDKLKDFMNTQFLQLSVQVARLERDKDA